MHKFAVVDIETTGLLLQDHSITEIAVVHVDEGVPRLVFQSLVQPNRFIPAAVSHLTGISERVLENAPRFDEILPKLAEVLADRIFVAHNANFDYSFLQSNLDKFGVQLSHQRLCTLKFCRKVFPGFSSYRLNSLCVKLGIENNAAHRAGGDAHATAELLVRLLKADTEGYLDALLQKRSIEKNLPAHLFASDVSNLPESPGVYYFHDSAHKPIYIGKAKNLRRRVLSHFSGSGSTRKKQLFQREIKKITFETTPSEYIACLLEDAEIKAHWPRHNIAQKSGTKAYAVVCYKDRTGFERLAVVRSSVRNDALALFGSLHEARLWLKSESGRCGWSLKRAGMFEPPGTARSDGDEQINFNQFIKESISIYNQSFVLAEPKENGPCPFALILNGRYKGFGTSEDLRTFDVEKIRRAPDSTAAQAVVRRMLMDDRVLKFPINSSHV
jgi:DNA polymerase-3 subunit epsilon